MTLSELIELLHEITNEIESRTMELINQRGLYLSRNVIILLTTNTIKNDGDRTSQNIQYNNYDDTR